jgi:hypothetical protein
MVGAVRVEVIGERSKRDWSCACRDTVREAAAKALWAGSGQWVNDVHQFKPIIVM